MLMTKQGNMCIRHPGCQAIMSYVPIASNVRLSGFAGSKIVSLLGTLC